MPFLTADALTSDEAGMAFLRDVLAGPAASDLTSAPAEAAIVAQRPKRRRSRGKREIMLPRPGQGVALPAGEAA